MATKSSSEPTDDKATEPATPPAETPEAVLATTAVASGPAPATAATTPVEPVAPAQPTVVFVQAPQPPKKRGARGVGVAVVLLATLVFAVVFAVLVGIIALVIRPTGHDAASVLASLAAPVFWVPVIVFALSYLLLVIIVNRAGWWAHVLGGFFVAILVYIAFIGAAIIQEGAFGADSATVNLIVLQQLASPFGFAAAIAAREVPIWVGGLVSRRGRTARTRNAEARTAYEQELADHRATLGANTAV